MRENMNDSFEKLQERVLDTLDKTDLLAIKEILASIDGPTLVSGVGGSHVVSAFTAKVLERKNDIVCENVTHRDLKYRNIEAFQNILVCSYGGKNYGVDQAFNNSLQKFLLSRGQREDATNLNYAVTDVEDSFISLAATLIPMTILLLYYQDDLQIVKNILDYQPNIEIEPSDVYEVLSGYETNTAATFIDSTMTEAGIGIPIIHDKYDYCHGRSTMNYNYHNSLIFFNNGNELDQLYVRELPNYYAKITEFKKQYDDDIINDYYLTYMSMYLCKKVAKQKEKDLARVQYSPLVKKLYFYRGDM